MRAPILVLTLAAVAATGGCARVRGHQGFVADQQLVDAIKPGIDNRESVTRTIGRPTFAGQFDANDWYYVARETRQFAFAQPRPVQESVLHVRFDAAGNVASIEKTGIEKVASINPVSQTTPTLGRHRSFFEDLFGNIGTVGSTANGAPTTDNPDGGN
ncbi:MAG: outer membrane protein assembly factor BamE [Sphingomonadaceae bacterium]|nr:outer membrane protein assembly factor BamE [Sphingomonadaceae bacterium]